MLKKPGLAFSFIGHCQDENHDGYFTVDELIKWIDKHKLVKFVEEGRDADMDRIMESQSSPQSQAEVKEEDAAKTR